MPRPTSGRCDRDRRSWSRQCAVWIAALGAACCLRVAQGSTIPGGADILSATFVEQIGGAGLLLTGMDDSAPESLILSHTAPGMGGAQGHAYTIPGLDPVAHVDLSINGEAPGGTGGSGVADIVYYWQAVGPATGEKVSVVLTAAGSVSRDGPDHALLGDAYALIVFSLDGEVIEDQANLCDALGCYNGDRSFNDVFNAAVTPDVTYAVHLQVLTSAPNVGPGDHAYFDGTLDPMIQIDPSDPNAGDYQLVFSANLDAPEPGAGWLVCAGVAMLLLGRYGGSARSASDE